MRLKSKNNLTGQEIMEALEERRDILRKYKVKKIGLFGSYARGEQRKRNDIDFLVEFEEPTFDNFMDLSFFLEDLFDKKVELITEGSLSPYIRPYVEKEVRWYEVQGLTNEEIRIVDGLGGRIETVESIYKCNIKSS